MEKGDFSGERQAETISFRFFRLKGKHEARDVGWINTNSFIFHAHRGPRRTGHRNADRAAALFGHRVDRIADDILECPAEERGVTFDGHRLAIAIDLHTV